MAAAEVEKLRSLGILGQGGSGKTSLGEAMLSTAGATQRLGKVLEGTSVLDHEPEEIKHHISISTAFHSLTWKKFVVTLIDTSPDDWDRYETLHWRAVEEWLGESPSDPDAPEVRVMHERSKRTYLRHGRDVLGWAIFACRKRDDAS